MPEKLLENTFECSIGEIPNGEYYLLAPLEGFDTGQKVRVDKQSDGDMRVSSGSVEKTFEGGEQVYVEAA